MPQTIPLEQTIAGSDNVLITLEISPQRLIVRYQPPPTENPLVISLAFRTDREIGAAILPFAQHSDGSTVFLPFKCDLLLSAEVRPGQVTCFERKRINWRWSDRQQTTDFEVANEKSEFVFHIP